MDLVVMVEERSMKVVLETLLPQIVPEDVRTIVIEFQGKSDLMKHASIKIRGWNKPDARFLIIRDQDQGDCKEVKQAVLKAIEDTDKRTIVRIVCHELEAWYFGDLQAVSEAYNRDILGYAMKEKYRDPDSINDVKERFMELIPDHQQIKGARLIAPHLSIERNTSRSFQAVVAAAREICK